MSTPFFIRNLFIVLGCFFCISCENTNEELDQFSGKRKIGVEEARKVEIIYTLGEKTSARIKAPLMLRHQEAEPFIEFPRTVSAEFFDDSLQVESRLTANYAKYIENESKVFLKDSVVVYNNIGDTLYCNTLYWDRNQPGREFYTNDPVRIRTRKEIINGDGLDAPQDFKSWHVINGKGIVRLPSGDVP